MRLFETFTINDLNPTGGIFVNHNPNKLKNAKLGPNITTLDKTLGGSPNDMIQIYRGTPDKNSQIAAGDYISTNKQLAKDWAGTGFVIGLKVKKGDILDDITEPGGEEYIYIPNAYKKVSNKLKNESKTMKLSQLRQIIREEAKKTLNEGKAKVAKTGKYEIRYTRGSYSVFLDGLKFGDDFDNEGGVYSDDVRLSIKNIEKLLKGNK